MSLADAAASVEAAAAHGAIARRLGADRAALHNVADAASWRAYADEAMKQLHRYDRSVGFLTYGWRTRDHPDPDNLTLRAVKNALLHPMGQHIKALFWE